MAAALFLCSSTSLTEQHSVTITGSCLWLRQRGGSGTYLIWGHRDPEAFTHHLGVGRQQTVAVVQSSRRHLLQHRLAGRHGVAAVVTDGAGGADLTLAVTHWKGNADGRLVYWLTDPESGCHPPTNQTCLLFDSRGVKESKQTRWPVHCCYLCSSAKASALATAQLPSASLISTQTWLTTSLITSAWRRSIKLPQEEFSTKAKTSRQP